MLGSIHYFSIFRCLIPLVKWPDSLMFHDCFVSERYCWILLFYSIWCNNECSQCVTPMFCLLLVFYGIWETDFDFLLIPIIHFRLLLGLQSICYLSYPYSLIRSFYTELLHISKLFHIDNLLRNTKVSYNLCLHIENLIILSHKWIVFKVLLM